MGIGVACTSDPALDPVDTPLPQLPIAEEAEDWFAEAPAWPYRRVTSFDLNADGTAERLVLAADRAPSDTNLAAGHPFGDDVRRWVLFVEHPGGSATPLYADHVPAGWVDAAVTMAEASGAVEVLVLEHAPHRMRTYLVAYVEPSRARAVSAAHYRIDRWVAPE